MKKRVFLVIFLCTTFVPHLELQAYKDTNTTLDFVTQLPTNKETILQVTPTKKMIKKELKRKRRLHRSLVSKYNETFNEKYLPLIQENSQKISELGKIIS